MKKVLLGLFLALVVVSLLLVALIACDDQEKAYAATNVSMPLPNGVVTPNHLPFCDFRDAVLVTQAPTVNSDSGIYYTAGTFGTNDVYPSVLNSKLIASAGSYVYIVFDCPSLSAVKFGFSAKRLSGSNYLDFTMTDGVNTYSDNGGVLGPITTSFKCFSVNVSNTYTGKRLLITLGVTYQTEFYNLKLASGYSNFGGFVVPEVLGLDDDSPSEYYDMGIVAPNLIDNSDFFEYPFYNGYDDDIYLNSDLDHRNEFFISNIPTSNFAYNLTDRYLSISNWISGKYLFLQKYGLVEDNTYIFTLCYESNVPLSISFTDLISDIDYGTFDIPLSDTSEIFTHTFTITDFSRLDIDISCSSSVESSLVKFYYCKMEQGEHFTGYIYPDRSISNEVRDNLLADYNFKTVPYYASFGASNCWCMDYNGDTYVSTVNPNGIRLRYVPSDYNLFYTPTKGFSSGDHLTMSMRCFTNKPFLISIIDTSGAEETVLYNYWFLESSSAFDISFTFIAPVSFRIQCQVAYLTDLYVYFAKLEVGDNFSGFSPSFSLLYDQAYDFGYAEGYIDGADEYSVSTKHLAFNNVENPRRIDNQGWSIWGFESGFEFYNATFDLVSLFYVEHGYTIYVSGKISITSNGQVPTSVNTIGASIFITRNPNFDLDSDPLDTSQLIILSVFSDYCTLDLYDPTYPVNWNPVEYPNDRVVELTISRNLQKLLDEYGDSKYLVGKEAGYKEGYDYGYTQGMASSLSKYIDSFEGIGKGSWYDFFFAFIDIPIMVITSLLDFELFGFNVLTLVKTIVLFSLLFLAFRLFFKGKVSV